MLSVLFVCWNCPPQAHLGSSTLYVTTKGSWGELLKLSSASDAITPARLDITISWLHVLLQCKTICSIIYVYTVVKSYTTSSQ